MTKMRYKCYLIKNKYSLAQTYLNRKYCSTATNADNISLSLFKYLIVVNLY